MAPARRGRGPGKPWKKGEAPLGKPFQKGTSGNPGGKPKQFADYIRECTLQGRELVDFALALMRGEVEVKDVRVVDRELVEVMKPPGHEVRMDAVKYLTDRGWGKAKETVELSGKDGGPIEAKALPLPPPDADRTLAIMGVLANVGVLQLPAETPAIEAPKEDSES